jgi:hypothetical protein
MRIDVEPKLAFSLSKKLPMGYIKILSVGGELFSKYRDNSESDQEITYLRQDIFIFIKQEGEKY